MGNKICRAHFSEWLWHSILMIIVDQLYALSIAFICLNLVTLLFIINGYRYTSSQLHSLTKEMIQSDPRGNFSVLLMVTLAIGCICGSAQTFLDLAYTTELDSLAAQSKKHRRAFAGIFMGISCLHTNTIRYMDFSFRTFNVLYFHTLVGSFILFTVIWVDLLTQLFRFL